MINWEIEPEIPPRDADYSDLMFTPAGPPEPEPELSPQQRQRSGFDGEAYQGQQLGGFQGRGSEHAPPFRERDGHRPLDLLGERAQPATAGAEICVFTGWPRRHIQIGLHCPHGLRENDERDT